jgi:hypothetical protein
MTTIGISGVGVASGPGAVGLRALVGMAGWLGAPLSDGAAPADARELMALRRRTGLRYLDPVAERAARAIDAASAEGEPADSTSDAETALRTGILMVTRLGPSSTREQLYKSLGERQGKGVSATVFSNCGYNIAAAVMAKVRGIRGPSLTFAATRGWGSRVLRFAEGLFARGAMDKVFLSYADGNAAIVLRAEPWEQLRQRAPQRALRVLEGLRSARARPDIAVGVEAESTSGEDAGDRSGGDVRRVPLRLLEGGSPGLALDPTFLSIAWLWEVHLQRGCLDVAPVSGWLVAANSFEPSLEPAPQEATP